MNIKYDIEEELKEKLRRLKISKASKSNKYIMTKTSASEKDLIKVLRQIRNIEEKLDKIREKRISRIMGI